MDTPAAIAIPAKIIHIPEKLKCKMCDNPVAISHTANNTDPMLLFIDTPFN
jgi:hypothetical protein